MRTLLYWLGTSCFFILLLAIAIGLLGLLLLGLPDYNFTGCTLGGEIFPSAKCKEQPLQSVMEFLFNLPVIFILAPILTVAGPPQMSGSSFMTLLYIVDVVLILGAMHGLWLVYRKMSGGLRPNMRGGWKPRGR